MREVSRERHLDNKWESNANARSSSSTKRYLQPAPQPLSYANKSTSPTPPVLARPSPEYNTLFHFFFSKTQPILDGILGVSLIVHSHIGFDSCLVDYLHERKFPIIGKIMPWLLRVATGLSVWGVYEFNTNDIGESGGVC